MHRLAIILVPLMLFAQETNNDELILNAHVLWNQYAKLANEWANQHQDYLTSKHDKDLFKQMLKAERRMEGAFRAIGY